MEPKELEKYETEIYYKINEIETQLNEMHDKILLKEIVNFCNEYEILDYEISIDMLKEALDLYIDKKEREKFGKDNNVLTYRDKLNEMSNKEYIREQKQQLKKAIMLLSKYCGNARSCRDCLLHSDTMGGCLFECGYPNQWKEVMEERESEVE